MVSVHAALICPGALPRAEAAPERGSEPPPAGALEPEPEAEAVDKQGGAHQAQAVPRAPWDSPRVAQTQRCGYQGETDFSVLCLLP